MSHVRGTVPGSAHRRSLVAAGLIAVIGLGVLAAFVLLRRDEGDDPALSAMSNRGTPIEMAVPERVGLAKLTGEAILIAERGGIRFLRLPRPDGSSCWATAERRSGLWHLMNYGCETDFLRFPDPKRPMMVVGRLQVDAAGLLTYTAFAGFAADGIKRIGVFDARNRLIEVTNVVDNVFFTPVPPADIRAVAALDATGEVIWRGAEAQLPDE